MKIKVEFDSLEEFQKYMAMAESVKPGKYVQQETPEDVLYKELSKGDSPHEEATKQESVSDSNALTRTDEKGNLIYIKTGEIVNDSFMVRLRGIMTEVNRLTGKNIAKVTIREMTGKELLTEVTKEDLPKLMNAMEELLRMGGASA